MLPQQRTWVLTDRGAYNFLKDQMTLAQAQRLINQLCNAHNALAGAHDALLKKVETLEAQLALGAGTPKN